jgi:hypothetical protein
MTEAKLILLFQLLVVRFTARCFFLTREYNVFPRLCSVLYLEWWEPISPWSTTSSLDPLSVLQAFKAVSD